MLLYADNKLLINILMSAILSDIAFLRCLFSFEPSVYCSITGTSALTLMVNSHTGAKYNIGTHQFVGGVLVFIDSPSEPEITLANVCYPFLVLRQCKYYSI